eukprot:gene4685-9283_t
MTIDEALCTKAINALYKHELKKRDKSSKPSLIGEFAKPILAQVELVKEIAKPVIRPVRVKIPNSLFSNDEDHSICFFCRTEDKDEIHSYLQSHPIPGFREDSLKSIVDVKKYLKQYKDKKKLLTEFTHFLCDSNVMNFLYNLLGKVFGQRNNYPVPIIYEKITGLEHVIQKAIDSTYMHLKGKNITIRFGHTAMTPSSVTENTLAGLSFAVEKLGGWNAIRSIHLKTADSAALPIFSKLPSDVLTYVKQLAGEETSKTITPPTTASSVVVSASAPKDSKKRKQPVPTSTSTPTASPSNPSQNDPSPKKLEPEVIEGAKKKKAKKDVEIIQPVSTTTTRSTKVNNKVDVLKANTATATIEEEIVPIEKKTSTPIKSIKSPKKTVVTTKSKPKKTQNKA